MFKFLWCWIWGKVDEQKYCKFIKEKVIHSLGKVKDLENLFSSKALNFAAFVRKVLLMSSLSEKVTSFKFKYTDNKPSMVAKRKESVVTKKFSPPNSLNRLLGANFNWKWIVASRSKNRGVCDFSALEQLIGLNFNPKCPKVVICVLNKFYECIVLPAKKMN